jgi:hypothetical protein
VWFGNGTGFIDVIGPRYPLPAAGTVSYPILSSLLVTRQGLVIGGGVVYPELNFTLPPMLVDQSTMTEAGRQYRAIILLFCPLQGGYVYLKCKDRNKATA